ELVIDVLKKIQPLDCKAGLTTVEKTPDRCRAYSFFEIGVVTDDHRIAAAELQGYALHILCGGGHYVLACRSCAGEADLPDALVFQKRFSDNPCGPGHDVQHTGRKTGLVQNLYGLDIRERSGSCGLDDDGISGDQRGSNLISQKGDREIPRHNRAANPDRSLE